MKLRHKFGLLAFLYVITLAANFALCSWCLLLYYRSFLERRTAESLYINPAESGSPDSRYPELAGGIAGMAEETEQGPRQVENETYILQVLGGNALCGLALGFLGLRLARRWVIGPIAALRDAAAELGQGNLSYRLRASSGDELGELANEVNSMASSIVAMQGQLVEHERRQVANQVLRCVVHNIRSPLTGIRWLAEAIGMRDDIDADTARRQGRIVEVVDRVLAWLQGFRESLAAISMQIRAVDVSQVVTATVDRCSGDAARRQIRINVQHATDVTRVRLEETQFASALHALLLNAVSKTTAGQELHLQVGRPDTMPGYWWITIEYGVGPTVAKSTESRSIGEEDWAMAERVIRLHGGRLQREDTAPGVCRYAIIVPG